MSTYFAILTEVGEAKLANAIALGQTLKLKNLAVGDGNGNLPMPSRTQKALVREVRRAGLNQLSIDPANASQIIVEQVLPEDVGGWWIREIGIYDEAGDLCAVANCPPSYKPLMAEGSGRTQVVRIVLIVASTAAIELKIDPSVILATRKYVDEQAGSVLVHVDRQLAAHLAAVDPHPQLAKRSYVDEQAGSVLVHGEKQLAAHLAAADPHPQLAQRSYVDEQAGSVLVHGEKQLAAHLAAPDPHPQLAQRSYVDEQAGSVLVYGEKQLAAHLSAPDPHPQLAQRSYVNEQAGSVLVYGEKQLAAHVGAVDPHPQYSMKTVATLPKFDMSANLASAAFVQQAQGNMVGYVGIYKNRTLTVDDIGCAMYFVSPGMAITMPSPESLGIPNNSGKCVKFFGLNVGGTILAGPGIAIGFDVGNVQTITLKQGQFINLMATGPGVWQVIDSTAELWRNVDLASFFKNESVSQNKFNSTNKIATTAFVQQAQGNLAGLAGITASRALLADDIGKAFYFINSNIRVTLPRPDSIISGDVVGRSVKFFGFATFAGTLTPDNGAYLSYEMGSVASLTVKPGQSLSLIAVNDTTWQVIGSTAEMQRNADFQSSLANTGHQTLPGGFILQWIAAANAGGNGNAVDTPYDIAFPNAVVSVSAIHIGSDTSVNITVEGVNPNKLAAVRLRSNYINGASVVAYVLAIGY